MERRGNKRVNPDCPVRLRGVGGEEWLRAWAADLSSVGMAVTVGRWRPLGESCEVEVSLIVNGESFRLHTVADILYAQREGPEMPTRVGLAFSNINGEQVRTLVQYISEQGG